jgi:putative transposase
MTSRSIYATQDEDGGCGPATLPTIPKELIDQFGQRPHDARGGAGRLDGVQEGTDRARAWRRVVAPPWLPRDAAKPDEAGNQRNGRSGKSVLTEDGPVRIDVPRDRRDGSFEPVLLIPKHARRFTVSYC